MSDRALAALVLATLAALAGCGAGPDPLPAEETIRASDLSRLTRTLASDEFAGRGPAARGETVTLDFLRGELERLGLEPMGDADTAGAPGWLQRVAAREITADPATASLRVPRRPVASGGRPRDLGFGDDFVAWTLHLDATIDVDAPVIFVGYGVVAPEEGWNDYKRDVSGAVVVILVNDPPVEGKFGDEAMTYYGRWTYKFEEAARQGAAGALIVHETGPAGYGWEVVRSSWSGPQFSLPVAAGAPPPARFEGWVTDEVANGMFDAAGLDPEELRRRAATAAFEPVDLGFRASLHLDSSSRTVDSHNVVAGLRGRDTASADDWILWTAHWDHLGEDPSIEGDGIYNGALDNATGVAGLLEIAEAFATQPVRTRRSHLFLATTLEEQGLLGSAHYAASPVVDPARTVAAINMDGLNIWGPTSDITVIGLGNSGLDDILRGVVAEQGRTLSADAEPEKGFYYRSDHFPLAKIGIPALYTDAGVDFVDQSADFARAARGQYTALHYHRPSDEFDPDWNFDGAVLDLRALFRVGFDLAEGDHWPEWSAVSEFRAAREASRDVRR